MTRLGMLAVAMAALMIDPAIAAECGGKRFAGRFGGVAVWRLSGALGFVTRGLAVDADGAPNAYRADNKGLSDLCDGSVAVVHGRRITPGNDPRHWLAKCRHAWNRAARSGDWRGLLIFGFEVDRNGVPRVQADGDPFPGVAYISTTSMPVPNTPPHTQRHWVNALDIPFYVLPKSVARTFHLRLGDIAAIYRPRTARLAFAVFADVGPALGEGSVRLHRELGSQPVVTRDGIERARAGIADPVASVILPGAHVVGAIDGPAWRAAINRAGTAAFERWGGVDRLRACMQ